MKFNVISNLNNGAGLEVDCNLIMGMLRATAPNKSLSLTGKQFASIQAGHIGSHFRMCHET
jgi:hypothetical protein